MMKPKALGAVVMVAFAWVLWIENSYWGKDSRANWEVVDGYETKAVCHQLRVNIVANEVKGFRSDTSEIRKHTPTRIYYFHKNLGTGQTKSFYCLPSDFDPRPRK